MTHTVQVNSRGQVTLPAELRRRLGLEPGVRLQIHEVEKKVILELEEEQMQPESSQILELFGQLNLNREDWELVRKWRAEDMKDL